MAGRTGEYNDNLWLSSASPASSALCHKNLCFKLLRKNEMK